jgi:hypothetical protein
MARADNDLLAMALVGYETEKSKIEAAIKDIQAQLGHRGSGRPKAAADGTAVPAKRVLSASARKKIAAAQRKRWAALKKSKAASAKAAAPKKRKLSAAGRKAIIAALRKRWAATRKAAAKKTKPVAKALKAAAEKPATAAVS